MQALALFLINRLNNYTKINHFPRYITEDVCCRDGKVISKFQLWRQWHRETSLTSQHVVVVVVVFLVVCRELAVRIQAPLQLLLSGGLLRHVGLLLLGLWAGRLRLRGLEATISRTCQTLMLKQTTEDMVSIFVIFCAHLALHLQH